MKLYFDFNDWWIGYYRGPHHHYVCVVPTLVFRWLRKRRPERMDFRLMQS